MTLEISLEDHPLLDPRAFITRFPRPLSRVSTPPEVLALFAESADLPMQSDDHIKKTVRDLLRHGGFKPTGRSKPASEYLIKAVEKGWFGPEKGINVAVDVCNVVSLHSGLPISVVDADLAEAPLSIRIVPKGTEYVFNPTGQVIDIGGLVCLCDASGPCGGPVKDSQRTKTHDDTRATLSVIWGTRELPGRTEEAYAWYRLLLQSAGLMTEEVALTT